MARPFFTEDQVRMIRLWLGTGEKSPKEIALETGVGVETIRRIGRRDTWNRLSRIPTELPKVEVSEAVNASLSRLLEELQSSGGTENDGPKVEGSLDQGPERGD